jgi:mono/diheme cytochrome c family protein
MSILLLMIRSGLRRVKRGARRVHHRRVLIMPRLPQEDFMRPYRTCLFSLFLAVAVACDDDDGGGGTDAATTDAGADALSAAAVRGQYLVENVLHCSDCHTPRTNGVPDMSKYLAGVQCFDDSEPTDPMRGCLASKNITPHPETGLGNLSREEIKSRFTKGMRSDQKNVHPQMPYWEYGNLTEADKDAVVAYLVEVVRPVNNMILANQPPNDMPFPRVFRVLPQDKIPAVPAAAANKESAERGRYLASVSCIGCHTSDAPMPMSAEDPVDVTKVFAGGRKFTIPFRGMPPQPEDIFTMNLTQHANGLLGYTADDVIRVLDKGIDKKGDGVCPPMGRGMMAGLYANLRDEDQRDIANYIVSLPPNDNMIPKQCSIPVPTSPDGGADGSLPGADASVDSPAAADAAGNDAWTDAHEIH